MIDTLLEAVAATRQPCSFLLLAPPLLTVVVLRTAWWSVAATFAAAIAGGWLLATSTVVLDGWLLQVSGVVVAGVIAAGCVTTDRLASPTSHAANASIAAAVTLLASLWWRPCVGIELGRLLTGAQTEPAAQLPGLAVYMVGAMLPVLVVALVWHTVAPTARAARAARIAAAGVAGIVAFAVAIGRHDAIVEVLAG